jgi:putative GTP pyrophosphokinase
LIDPLMSISDSQLKRIDRLVDHYVSNQDDYEVFLDQVLTLVTRCKPLRPHVHSFKGRVKDPTHLKDKLIRKMLDAKKKKERVDITEDNLFTKINDLAGIRILHLYTRQMDKINFALKHLLEEAQYPLLEGPEARTWDDESRRYFTDIGIATKDSPSLYTSVHYVIEANSRTKYTCEIQVRTLMEEVWGEVDHTINYPHRVDSVACREQLMALARMTSSCTRLVDSIFRSYEDHQQNRIIAIPASPISVSDKQSAKKIPRRRK